MSHLPSLRLAQLFPESSSWKHDMPLAAEAERVGSFPLFLTFKERATTSFLFGVTLGWRHLYLGSAFLVFLTSLTENCNGGSMQMLHPIVLVGHSYLFFGGLRPAAVARDWVSCYSPGKTGNEWWNGHIWFEARTCFQRSQFCHLVGAIWIHCECLFNLGRK